MTPIFPQLPHNLGGYTLTRLLAGGEDTELYEATQARVGRAVILRILRPGMSRERESAFLNRARMCAAADELPHTARVVESLRADGLWFLAQERPSGYSLADLQALGHMLTAPQACRIIKTVAEVYTLCENAGLKVGALDAADIYLNAENTISLLSPSAKEEADSVTIRRTLAADISPMRPIGVDGEHRILTLLQWLTDGYEDGSPVDWDTFRNTCADVCRQLEESRPEPPPPALNEARTRRKKSRTKRTLFRTAGIGIAALLTIGVMGAAGLLFPLGEPGILPADHEGFLTCRRHGITQRVMLRPVSVAEYEQFLLALENMSDAEKDAINRDVPEDCRDHLPAEWETLIAAANGQDAAARPMVHVNYWDALAYARYIGNGATLPDASQLQVVHANSGASGLTEWSSSSTGSNPLELYAKDTPLLIRMAEAPTPVPADSPSMRRPQCGFRLAFPDI